MAIPNGLADELLTDEWLGVVDDTEAAVVRMRHGVTVPSNAPLARKGAPRGDAEVRQRTAATLDEVEQRIIAAMRDRGLLGQQRDMRSGHVSYSSDAEVRMRFGHGARPVRN